MCCDHRGNEDNTNRSVGKCSCTCHGIVVEAAAPAAMYHLPRPNQRPLGIEDNQIWIKEEKENSRFQILKDHKVPRYMSDKRYWVVTPDSEVWGKTSLISQEKGRLGLQIESMAQGQGSVNTEAKYNSVFRTGY